MDMIPQSPAKFKRRAQFFRRPVRGKQKSVPGSWTAGDAFTQIAERAIFCKQGKSWKKTLFLEQFYDITPGVGFQMKSFDKFRQSRGRSKAAAAVL
ncbi:MAG TPA: hypothetical protein H9707_08560 [Candidatus Butyricicoccus avicola]|nr:hypothetical protein [Candidatus Butyricicoccus avicola]